MIKFAWHMFHNKLYCGIEPSEYRNRIVEITNNKPMAQQPLRLLLFKMVKSKRDLDKMNRKDVLALHAKECPGCCWNEKKRLLFASDEYSDGLLTSDLGLRRRYLKALKARTKTVPLKRKKKNVSRKVR